MADVFDRLQALKGKSRGEIVAGSASTEWEKTDLFLKHPGRDGTGNLVEIILAQCGRSGQDKATPLLAVALTLKASKIGSAEEKAAITATRIAAADALMANAVPYEFGAGDMEDNTKDQNSPRNVATLHPELQRFTGQETTRQSFLQTYATLKPKGHTGSATIDSDDPNAAPVNKKVAVGKKVKFRPHEQVEAAIPQYLQPSDAVIIARDAGRIEAMPKAQVTKMLSAFAGLLQMASMPKQNKFLDLLETVNIPGIKGMKSDVMSKIQAKVDDHAELAKLLYHAAHFLFMSKQHIKGGEQMTSDDLYASEVCGRALCEYAAVKQVNVGATDLLSEIRQATGIAFSDHMQKYVTLDRNFTAEETTIIMTEIREQLEVKKLVKEVGGGGFAGSGGGAQGQGVDRHGNALPLCKRFGRECFSWQKGNKCSHQPKQNYGGKGKRKWGR